MVYANSISRVLLVGFALYAAGGCARFRSGGDGAAVGGSETGVASYYADKYHGRPTASGEPFDLNSMTAAHRTLPFGTKVRVTHAESGQSVTVRVNDRGPFVKGRVIDLSYAAARKLGIVQAGVARVRLDVLQTPTALARGS